MKKFRKNRELKELMDLKPVTDEEFEELLEDPSKKELNKKKRKK